MPIVEVECWLTGCVGCVSSGSAGVRLCRRSAASVDVASEQARDRPLAQVPTRTASRLFTRSVNTVTVVASTQLVKCQYPSLKYQYRYQYLNTVLKYSSSTCTSSGVCGLRLPCCNATTLVYTMQHAAVNCTRDLYVLHTFNGPFPGLPW